MTTSIEARELELYATNVEAWIKPVHGGIRVMNKLEWDEMYRKLYDVYDYAGLRNEYVRKHLGELLDYMGQYKERFQRPID